MKTRLLIPFVILISINFTHCRKKEIIDLGIKPIDFSLAFKGKLKSITKTSFVNEVESQTVLFNYDNNGALNQIYNFDYKGDTISNYLFKVNSDKLLSSDTTFAYNDPNGKLTVRNFTYEDGRIMKVVETFFPSEQVLEYHYKYTYNGKVDKIEIQRFFNGNLLTIGKGEFNWEKGNLIALKDNLALGQYEEYEYQYDENSNYLNEFIKNEFPLFTFDAAYLSENNMVAMKSTFQNKVLKIDTEFDEDSKPLLKTISELIDGQWQAIREESFAYWE